jgi:SPP1 gp7 family putative phage head morphogenesis protein
MPKRPHGNIPADPKRFEEAIDAFRKRVPIRKDEWETLTRQEREYAFTVAEVAQADLVTDVYEAIDKAISAGTTLEEFKRDVGAKLEDAWGEPRAARVETIFRTNVLGAYNEGRHAILTAPAVKEARPYWRFDAVEDSRTSDICDELDGTILPADDPFWDSHTPPLHFQCRSVLTPLSEEEATDEGENDEAPDAEPDEGFGAAPSREGEDWEPDLSEYPEEIADELGDRLG